MSKEETTPTPSGADVDPLEQMADFLMGEPDDQPDTETPGKAPEANADDLEEDPEASTAEDAAEGDDAEVDELEDTETDPDEEDDDRSLSQLLGLGDDQVSVDEATGELSINTKVEGVASTVPFKDVIAGYQTNQYNTHKAQALADERRTFEAAAGKKAGEIKQVLELNSALTERLQGELMREFQTTNWEELRSIDPAEYAARQQDMSVRYNQLQQIQQQVTQQYGQANQQQQQQNTDNFQAELGKQRDVMISNNPTWNDPAVMKADVGKIREFLTETYGLTPEDIAVISDAKAISIIQDAMTYRKGIPAAKKRVAAVPKMQKSKGAKRRKVSKLDKLTRAAKSATGSQKRDLQTDAIAELLSGG